MYTALLTYSTSSAFGQWGHHPHASSNFHTNSFTVLTRVIWNLHFLLRETLLVSLHSRVFSRLKFCNAACTLWHLHLGALDAFHNPWCQAEKTLSWHNISIALYIAVDAQNSPLVATCQWQVTLRSSCYHADGSLSEVQLLNREF